MEYNNLVTLIKERGFGVVEFAKIVGLTPTGLKKGWVNETISLKNIKKICLELDCTFGFFAHLESTPGEGTKDHTGYVTRAEFADMKKEIDIIVNRTIISNIHSRQK